MKALNVKNVVFDLGNTIILDPFERVVEKQCREFERILRNAGYEASREEIKEAWKYANKKVDYPFITHFFQEIPIVKFALQTLGVKEGLNEIASDMLISYRKGLMLVVKEDERNEEVREVLDFLKRRGKSLYLLSNDRYYDAFNLLKWSGLLPLFDKIFTSDEIGFEKPSVGIFRYFMKSISSVGKECVYVGDDPRRDIEPAKLAGMYAVQYTGHSNMNLPWRDYSYRPRLKPDAVIKDLHLLKEIIK